MRLSRNWLVSSIATLYIEIIRNMPLLLQMFVWYGVVLKSLPGPREAINFSDMFFLSNRGLNMPDPIFGDSAWLGLVGLGGWNHRRHCPAQLGAQAAGRNRAAFSPMC